MISRLQGKYTSTLVRRYPEPFQEFFLEFFLESFRDLCIVNQFDLRPVGVKCIVVSDRLFSGVFPENDNERTAYDSERR